MSTISDKARAEFAVEMDRQRQQLLQQAQGGGIGTFHMLALIWPVLLIGFAVFEKDLSSAEQFVATAAAMGLIFSYVAAQVDASRRMRALLRLLERSRSDASVTRP